MPPPRQRKLHPEVEAQLLRKQKEEEENAEDGNADEDDTAV